MDMSGFLPSMKITPLHWYMCCCTLHTVPLIISPPLFDEVVIIARMIRKRPKPLDCAFFVGVGNGLQKDIRINIKIQVAVLKLIPE
jgi:hypothetical protein